MNFIYSLHSYRSVVEAFHGQERVEGLQVSRCKCFLYKNRTICLFTVKFQHFCEFLIKLPLFTMTSQ